MCYDDIMSQPINSVFGESTQYRKSDDLLSHIMSHILKLKYCTNTRNHVQWYGTIKRSLIKIYNYILDDNRKLKPGKFKEDDKYSSYYDGEVMDRIYIYSIKEYDEAMKNFPDLKP